MIDVAPGTYVTTVNLTQPLRFRPDDRGHRRDPGRDGDRGAGRRRQSTVNFGAGFGIGSLTLSNLTVYNPVGQHSARRSAAPGTLTLSGVVVLLAETTSNRAGDPDSLGRITLDERRGDRRRHGDGVDAGGAR